MLQRLTMDIELGFSPPSGVPKIGPFSRVSAHGRALRIVEQDANRSGTLLNGSIFGEPQAATAGRPFLSSLSFGRAKERDSHAGTLLATKTGKHSRVKPYRVSS